MTGRTSRGPAWPGGAPPGPAARSAHTPSPMDVCTTQQSASRSTTTSQPHDTQTRPLDAFTHHTRITSHFHGFAARGACRSQCRALTAPDST
eukprot:200964-Prymnesium_polylepis.1